MLDWLQNNLPQRGHAMKNRANVLFASIAVSLLAAPAVGLADDHNPLKDPSFEDELSADAGGWGLFEHSLFSDGQARTGSRSMYNGGLSKTVAYHPYFIGTVAGGVGDHEDLGGSRGKIDGRALGIAGHLELGLGDPGIAGAENLDTAWNRLGAIGHGRHGLGAAGAEDAAHAAHFRRREDFRGNFPVRSGRRAHHDLGTAGDPGGNGQHQHR